MKHFLSWGSHVSDDPSWGQVDRTLAGIVVEAVSLSCVCAECKR